MERLEKYYNQIKNSPLFFGMNDEELRGLLECFNARVRKYEKEEMIIRQGDMITNIYLILDGEVNIEKDSYWGRRIIISHLGKNDNLALSFVGSKNVESSIDAITTKDTLVLILGYEKCTSMCQNACTRHKVLNVDRSAMSFELSKLQKEGLIEYNKNHFVLLSQ